jgi:hypothetical protein
LKFHGKFHELTERFSPGNTSFIIASLIPVYSSVDAENIGSISAQVIKGDYSRGLISSDP